MDFPHLTGLPEAAVRAVRLEHRRLLHNERAWKVCMGVSFATGANTLQKMTARNMLQEALGGT